MHFSYKRYEITLVVCRARIFAILWIYLLWLRERGVRRVQVEFEIFSEIRCYFRYGHGYDLSTF